MPLYTHADIKEIILFCQMPISSLHTTKQTFQEQSLFLHFVWNMTPALRSKYLMILDEHEDTRHRMSPTIFPPHYGSLESYFQVMSLDIMEGF